ncbi:MAG: hypothetical protein SFV24_02795 [Gemmatimonadales bacterium]|nr:hypothetical protein [Gemmatimonadales bacterium]
MSDELQEAIDYLPHDGPPVFRRSANGLDIALPPSSAEIRFSSANCRQIRGGRRPQIDGLTYYDHCGFHFADTAEFLFYLSAWGEWPVESALRFRIGGTLVTVGRVSPVLPLLFEPYYRDKYVLQYEFARYSSIRLTGVSADEARSVVHSALFHLNARYLAPAKTGAQIMHLLPPGRPYEQPSEDDLGRITRRRVLTRPRLKTLEPGLLFNAASTEEGEARFLGFYRVLEFYFTRALEEDIERLRLDGNTTARDLIAVARERTELDMLRRLLNAALTTAQRTSLLAQLQYRRLASRKPSTDLAGALYAFRCSLVHAKQAELHRTRIPDPLVEDSTLGSWNYLVRRCAELTIRRYCLTMSNRGHR